MPCDEQLLLFFGRWIIHLQRRESIELRRVDPERAGKFGSAVDRGDELNVVRDLDERVLDRMKHAPRRVERWHEGVARAFLAAVELVEKNQIAPRRVLVRLLE